MTKVWVATGFGVVLMFMATPILLLMVTLMGGAAKNNDCVEDVGIIADAGGPVRPPITGSYTTTSQYGMRHNPVTGRYSKHYGLDFSASNNTIVSVKAGVVKATPTTYWGGNEIHISHGPGQLTKYQHLAKRSVKTGDRVWSGKPIGVQGTTGNSTGVHLHLEVHVNGADVSPNKWFAAQGIKIPSKGVRATSARAAVVPAAGSSGSALTPVSRNLGPAESGGATNQVISALPAKVGIWKRPQLVDAGRVIKAGQSMELDAKTITIGVMTAMGESSLVNVDRGDAVGPDSRGLFQQRANGVWGSYSDRMNPTIASTNFFKALIKVPNYRSLSPTIAAHKTQRNADPNHYTKFWSDAVQVVSALTADPGLLAKLAVDGPVAGCENGGPVDDLPAGDGSGAAVVTAAKRYLGTPYSWGGGNATGPSLGIRSSASLDGTRTVGFDCSGFVLFAVHKAAGITLAHHAEVQGNDKRGKTIARDWARIAPGDIIAFSENGSGNPGSFGHVGIYVGDGKMIHAPRPGKTVEITQLRGNGYYEKMAWAIKRYTKS